MVSVTFALEKVVTCMDLLPFLITPFPMYFVVNTMD